MFNNYFFKCVCYEVILFCFRYFYLVLNLFIVFVSFFEYWKVIYYFKMELIIIRVCCLGGNIFVFVGVFDFKYFIWVVFSFINYFVIWRVIKEWV